jgi:hypothetical protein
MSLKTDKLSAGMRVQISEGSGLDSGKQGELLSWTDSRTRIERASYPFVGGRTPQSMHWSPILLDSGRVVSIPNNRIERISQ